MQVNRLFKVLVMGGAALTVGCTADDGTPGKRDGAGQRGPGQARVDQAGKQKDAGVAGDSGTVMDPPVVGADSGTGVVLIDAGGGAGDADAGGGSWLHWV